MAQTELNLADARKARGAFFTPTPLTEFLATWAVRTRVDTVLEPSCGEAAFLLSAGARLQQLGAGALTDQMHGVELHEPSAVAAAQAVRAAGLTATIRTGDFFDVERPGSFDAVLGNPPYVRYQGFTGEARSRGQRAAFAQGVKLGNLSSSWAAFVVHAAAFLKPEGRLGLVLPAELLTVNYAGPVRRFLMERFAHVRLVLFEERVFPGVMEEVVLLLAEGSGPTDHFSLCQVADDAHLSELNPRLFFPTDQGGKWTPALLPSDAVEPYARLTGGDGFAELQEWGATDLGIVTGNNGFFTLTVAQATELGLKEHELLAISPRGSRHLRGLNFTDKAWREMARIGSRVYLFSPSAESPSPAALAYIAQGEAAGVEKAYKCRMRSPWWRVPLVRRPDLFLTYMNHDAPRLVANRARVRALNSVHGLSLKTGRRQLGMDLLPIASLNSVTLLGAELVGRSYGGGILKVEPKEADVLPVPSSTLVEKAADELRALRPQLAQHLRNSDILAVAKAVDRVLFRHLDAGRSDAQALRAAREELFSRRATRSRA